MYNIMSFLRALTANAAAFASATTSFNYDDGDRAWSLARQLRDIRARII